MININGITSKILCTHHNNSLSEIDRIGTSAFKVINDAVKYNNLRNASGGEASFVHIHRIDGETLEKWLLKTLINISLSTSTFIGRGNTCKNCPRKDLLDILYNGDNFKSKAGLYALVRQNMHVSFQKNTFGFTPFIDEETYIEGGLFLIDGLSFVLCLEQDGIQDKFLNYETAYGDVIRTYQLNYRNSQIDIFDKNKKLSQQIKFIWDNKN